MPSEFDLFDECDAVDGVLKLDDFDASDPDGLLSVLIRLYACPLPCDRGALWPSAPLYDPLDPLPVRPPSLFHDLEPVVRDL